ncbi:MAG: hypothetical protein JWN76_2688 [Chitinophagaceae bacterium]|nr:hypothetical protein [Chitinophagaceae bacterium]
MKKLVLILSVAACIAVISCNDIRRKPGDIYMPDMAYSRAYETYADHSNLKEQGINYTNMPVAGTIARGEEAPFPYAKDRPGDTANYVASRSVQNPYTQINGADSLEAARLYLINCAICHGPGLDGNGPLYKGGDGPFPAAPKNLISDPYTVNMPDGQMFYSVTYGRNLMGAYGSQLNRKQRWMIITYIKGQQGKQKAAGGASAAGNKIAAPGNTTPTKAGTQGVIRGKKDSTANQ